MVKLLKDGQFLLMLCLCFFNYSFSQIKEQKKDSSEAIYEKTEYYSEKTKTTKLLHWVIFKSNKISENKTTASQKQDSSNFEGKIIQHIMFQSHDPFGLLFTDSTETANS